MSKFKKCFLSASILPAIAVAGCEGAQGVIDVLLGIVSDVLPNLPIG